MKKEQIFSLVRHVLSAIGGILIAKGLLSEGVVMDLTGTLLTVGAIIWSIFDKTFEVNKVEGAARQLLTSVGLFVAFFNPTVVEQIVGFIGGALAIILGQTSKVKTPAEGAENK